jgi:DNA-binding PucR family transcriptional regulator
VLKVDRHTVKRRLHKIEESLGRALHTCQAELELALRLEALGEITEIETSSIGG